MGFIEDIKRFVPSDAAEAEDKRVILKYCDMFDNILLRDSEIAHITSSGFVVNESVDKTLMAFHNIYKAWAWTGGHADGDGDLLHVAIKEAMEETGIRNVRPMSKEIVSIDILPVYAHIKHGKPVSSHLHLSVAYLLVADDTDKLVVRPQENSDVEWLPLDTLISDVAEECMKPVYSKIINKAYAMSGK